MNGRGGTRAETARRGGAVFGLDVVRAAAVSLVLLSHGGDIMARWFGGSNWRPFSFGAYYGIELFFVLSGFLIGGLLIAQLDREPGTGEETGRLGRGWLVFMARRWMRTLPLYYLWVAVLAVFWAPLIWPHAGGLAGRLGGALAWYGTMLQNLAWPMRDANFFDVSWSLAVEEWFYLGFSALLFGLAAWWRRGALAVACGVFVAGPVLLRWWLRGAPPASDHLVIFWLDSIGLGVCAAWIAARRPGVFRAAAWGLPVALGLVVLTYTGGLARFGVSEHWRRTLDFDVLAVALAMMLPAAARWRQARGPAAWVVRRLSRYSYALYLTHLTILAWVDVHRAALGLSAGAAVMLSVAAIGGISYAMSRFVERPIMRLRPGERARGAGSS